MCGLIRRPGRPRINAQIIPLAPRVNQLEKLRRESIPNRIRAE
jgi:hypothetical protein